MVTGIFAGSFDPPTYGHLNIVKRAMLICDRLIVTIAVNPSKKYLFTEEERVKLFSEFIRKEVDFLDSTNINVTVYQGLIVNQAKETGASVLIRGCHGASDYESEEKIANINFAISRIETVLFPTPPEMSIISSSATKEIAKHGGSLRVFVPDFIATAIQNKLAG